MSTSPTAMPPPEARRPLRLASRYSRFVDLMRFMLPLLALLLIALVVFWPQVMGAYGNLISPRVLSGEIDEVDAMRMFRPRYLGQSGRAEPYVVTAASAELDPAKPERIRLDQLAAEIMTEGERDVRLNAREGVYHRASERLELAGGIELMTSDGYHFATESARVSLKRGWVKGKMPVAGSGPAGTLSADRFEIRDGGDVLYFEGRVRVTLPSQAERGTSS